MHTFCTVAVFCLLACLASAYVLPASFRHAQQRSGEQHPAIACCPWSMTEGHAALSRSVITFPMAQRRSGVAMAMAMAEESEAAPAGSTSKMVVQQSHDRARSQHSKAVHVEGKHVIYGPYEDEDAGTLPKLDENSGHFGVTPDSNGKQIYHYHLPNVVSSLHFAARNGGYSVSASAHSLARTDSTNLCHEQK